MVLAQEFRSVGGVRQAKFLSPTLFAELMTYEQYTGWPQNGTVFVEPLNFVKY